MQLHDLQRKTPNQKAKRVGRGGGRGKTSGRGTKGQKARAGHRIMPAIREQLKKLPKQRGRGIHGLKSIEEKPSVVNLSTLEKFFSANETITPALLLERGVIRARKGSRPQVKILGTGEVTKKFTLSGMTISGSAKEKLEKAGGSIA
jgi:large subunit ribosomal protein L15